MPLRHGIQRGRPMPARPVVARGCRIDRGGRHTGIQGSTHEAPTRGGDFESISRQTTQEWVTGSADYRHLRLLTSGVAGTGESFVIHAMTDILLNLLGFGGAENVPPLLGASDLEIGGPTGRLPLRAPNHPGDAVQKP